MAKRRRAKRYGALKHDPAKIRRRAGAGNASSIKKLGINGRVYPTLGYGAGRDGYTSDVCVRAPKGNHRFYENRRCASGSGTSPTRAFKAALTNLVRKIK